MKTWSGRVTDEQARQHSGSRAKISREHSGQGSPQRPRNRYSDRPRTKLRGTRNPQHGISQGIDPFCATWQEHHCSKPLGPTASALRDRGPAERVRRKSRPDSIRDKTSFAAFLSMSLLVRPGRHLTKPRCNRWRPESISSLSACNTCPLDDQQLLGSFERYLPGNRHLDHPRPSSIRGSPQGVVHSVIVTKLLVLPGI